MIDFFISYNNADRRWAEWVAWTLESEGFTTIIQDWDFVGNWVLQMNEAMQQSKRTIAILSKNYIDSAFTQPELANALRQDPRGVEDALIPVRVEAIKLSGWLSQLVYVDFVGRDEVSARKDLIGRVKRQRRKPDEQPAFPGGTVQKSIAEKPAFPTLPPAKSKSRILPIVIGAIAVLTISGVGVALLYPWTQNSLVSHADQDVITTRPTEIYQDLRLSSTIGAAIPEGSLLVEVARDKPGLVARILLPGTNNPAFVKTSDIMPKIEHEGYYWRLITAATDVCKRDGRHCDLDQAAKMLNLFVSTHRDSSLWPEADKTLSQVQQALQVRADADSTDVSVAELTRRVQTFLEKHPDSQFRPTVESFSPEEVVTLTTTTACGDMSNPQSCSPIPGLTHLYRLDGIENHDSVRAIKIDGSRIWVVKADTGSSEQYDSDQWRGFEKDLDKKSLSELSAELKAFRWADPVGPLAQKSAKLEDEVEEIRAIEAASANRLADPVTVWTRLSSYTAKFPNGLLTARTKDLRGDLPAFFKDCADCPTMAVLPKSANGEVIAMSAFEVTIDEFRRSSIKGSNKTEGGCTIAGHRGTEFSSFANWSDGLRVTNGTQPVVCVSLASAVGYVDWLNAATGNKLEYRLPTKAEWLFAHAAGPPPNIDASPCILGNVADMDLAEALPEWPKARMYPCHDGFAYSAPVHADFPANRYGLYDMDGNVSEMVHSAGESGAEVLGLSWRTLRALGGAVPERDEGSEDDIGFRVVRPMSSKPNAK